MRRKDKKIRVLMIGTDKSTGGGMWTVVSNYLDSALYNKYVDLHYVPTFVVGSSAKKIAFSALAYIRIVFYCVLLRPQILHVHMAERGSVYRKGIAIRIAKFFNCKVVIHMHGAEFQEWYEALIESKKNKVRYILDKADKIILLGNYWKEFISNIVDLRKIEVVYNAVPKQNNIYNNNGNILLFLGMISQRKGTYDLINAFSEILDSIPKEINLNIYGPDFENRIEEVIDSSGANERIRYCGWLDKKSKSYVFSKTIGNVLPSYNEGLPMTILETMSFGIPNVSTRVAAIPEVIDEYNGELVNPGDINELKKALIELCCNNEKRCSMSKAAYRTIDEKFSIDVHVNRIVGIYKGILYDA